jgi:predicted DNA-binding protein (MmcQ/YjbR family)
MPSDRPSEPGTFPLVDHCRSLLGTTEDIKWESDLCFSVGGKMYAVFDPAKPDTPTFKCDAFDFERLTTLDGIRPAAYLARAQWVSLLRPDALPLDETRALLTKSHDLVMARLPKKVQASLT